MSRSRISSRAINNRRLPQVSEQGPEAFAGVYTVRLHDAGLLEDQSIRWCPSLELPAETVSPVDSSVRLVSANRVVSAQQLHDATVDQLKQWQRSLGGHYAYTLGVVDRDTYLSPRFEGRSSFAIMSDAPMITLTNRVIPESKIGHDGFGINVLFEDGRVQFYSLSSLESMPDHPLLNDRGDAEAGVNVDDASLAPSWRPPFLNVRQR